MEYTDQVKDFINRCNSNLQLIEKNSGFEFTQLLSNLISTLIFVKENKNINKEPLLNNNLNCKINYNSYPINFLQNTNEFVRHLRNACCHYGIKILSKNGDIDRVVFKDKDERKGYICEFELEIEDIKKAYIFLINYI